MGSLSHFLTSCWMAWFELVLKMKMLMFNWSCWIFTTDSRGKSSLSSPSHECFNKCREHLLAMKTSPCSVVSSFMAEKNAAVDFLLTDTCWTKVPPFIEIVWSHSFLMIQNHIVKHPEEIVINISRQGFTEATSRPHEFFTSTEFSQYVRIVFG